MRPVVSKKGLMGFGVEISIDIKLSGKFTKELRDNEKEEKRSMSTYRIDASIFLPLLQKDLFNLLRSGIIILLIKKYGNRALEYEEIH